MRLKFGQKQYEEKGGGRAEPSRHLGTQLTRKQTAVTESVGHCFIISGPVQMEPIGIIHVPVQKKLPTVGRINKEK